MYIVQYNVKLSENVPSVKLECVYRMSHDSHHLKPKHIKMQRMLKNLLFKKKIIELPFKNNCRKKYFGFCRQNIMEPGYLENINNYIYYDASGSV